MEHQMNQPSSDSIIQIGTGFCASKILLSAVKFELFTKLAEKSMSAYEVKSNLGFKCTDRNVYDFLDALTSFGFLDREGLLDTAIYSNSISSDYFLDKKKLTYIGGMLEMMNSRMYGFWGNLEEGLLTGLPQNEAKNGVNIFEILYSDDNKLREFISSMSGYQMTNFSNFAQKFDFSKYKTLVDVGGSSGLLSLMVAKYQSHMNCVSWDLPPVTEIANKVIEKYNLQDRVKASSGDFFKNNFPNADIITMASILHDWNEEIKLMLIKKAYDALPENGILVVIENIIDDERKKNTFGLVASLHMLIETGTGFDYTFQEFNKWAEAIGFKSTSFISLTGPTSAAISYK